MRNSISVTVTLDKRRYFRIYYLIEKKRKSVSYLVQEELYKMSGLEPPPYRRNMRTVRLIPPYLDKRSDTIKMAVYLNQKAVKLADNLAKKQGLSRRALVAKALDQALETMEQEMEDHPLLKEEN